MKKENEQTVEVVRKRERAYLKKITSLLDYGKRMDFNKETETNIQFLKSLSFLCNINNAKRIDRTRNEDGYV